MTQIFRANHIEAEKAALGCVLFDNEAARELSTSPQTLFTTKQHRALHRAISEVVGADEEMDFLTVKARLEKNGDWSDETKLFILELMENSPPPAQVTAYIRLLKNAAKQRSIIEAARRVEQKASERFLDEEELTQLQDSFQQAAFQIAVADEERRGPEPISSLLGSLIHDLDARAERRNLPSGIRTGFTKLDHYTTGFQPGELVIVCGRPGHGKTAFALDVSLYVARHVPVVLFSLEMSANQIAQRLAAKLGRINLRTVRSATLSDTEFSRLVTAWGQSDDLQLYIDDSGIVSPAQVRSRARELAIRIGRPAGLIMVDYLQLMAPGRKYDNREREIASISREMKLTAKVLNCPVLMASQLNRELEKRADKRPIVSDLRESGAIEQDCDVCIGLYLPFNYSNQDEDRNEAEAILLKQRNGPIGTISLFWQSETTSFHDPI